ncbi:proline rich transmembrane protein 1B [Pimephales promelas]|uniref:proline rich transmembrane protein 1B n=1 Tax=Pimephales promelas TaxID=90988 RepID=UPI0019559226|nr:proline rich transmembrane protein 1B [Pimephales promelas]
MDTATPPNFPDDPRQLHQRPPGLQETPREPAILPSIPAYDSISILTAGPTNDTDSIQTGHPVTDGDSIQTGHPAYDTDSNQTAHLAYETDSNRTLNPAFDTDSTHTLHPVYTLDRGTMEGVPGPPRGDGPTSSIPLTPPPYTPPDPKTAYLVFPSQMSHYPNQPVITCQPGANPPAFYQPPFLPPATYPSYTIYMNGPALGEEQTPVPKDYLVESLLVTIFCCIMSGLVAVMYSYETRAALTRGDIREAEKTSQKARLLVMFSLMFGIFVFVGWIIYVVIVLCA